MFKRDAGKRRRLARPFLALMLLYILIIAAFVLAGKIDAEQNRLTSRIYRHRAVKEELCGTYALKAVVTDICEKENGRFLTLKVLGGALDAYSIAGYNLSDKVVSIGDELSCFLKVYLPERASNPGQFDAYIYYSIRGTDFLFQAYSLKTVGHKKMLLGPIRNLRESLNERLFAYLPKREAALLSAILLGNASLVDAETKTLFQGAGIAHILAVSGLHVSLLFSSVDKLLVRLLPKRRGLSSAIALLVLWFYVLLCGASSSTLRAAIMLSTRKTLVFLYLDDDSLTSLALSAVTILLIQPLYLLDAGFLLSFSAMLGLYYLSPIFSRMFFLPRRLRSALSQSLSTGAGMLPFVLNNFGYIPLYASFLNLFVVPLMSLVFLLGWLGLLAALVFPLGGNVLLGAVYYILRLYEFLSGVSLSLPKSRIYPGSMNLLQTVLYYAFWASLVYMFSQRKQERKRLCALPLVFAGLFLVFGLVRPAYHLCFLNVGQGDCAVLETRGVVSLFDAGPAYSRVIKPYLLHRGITKIDYCFISHPDLDHCEGLIYLLQDEVFNVDYVILAEPFREGNENAATIADLAKRKGTELLYWSEGAEMTLHSMSVFCLGPTACAGNMSLAEDANDSSQILYLRLKKQSFILPGDISSNTEKNLLTGQFSALKGLLSEDKERGCIVCLKCAHHGSKNSSCEPFLKAISPAYTIVSSKKSVYGHPHVQTLRRLSEVGTELFLTEEDGAVSFGSFLNIAFVRSYFSHKFFMKKGALCRN